MLKPCDIKNVTQHRLPFPTQATGQWHRCWLGEREEVQEIAYFCRMYSIKTVYYSYILCYKKGTQMKNTPLRGKFPRSFQQAPRVQSLWTKTW